MKHFTKHLSIILSAAILLSGCKSQSVGAADAPTEDLTSEQTELSQPESAPPEESEAPEQTAGRFEVERDFIRFSLNDKPFGLDFESLDSWDEDGAHYMGWMAGDYDQPGWVLLQYGRGDADWVADSVTAEAEKTAGQSVIEYLDITQTDSGQSVIAIADYVCESEYNEIHYSLIAECGNGYCIYLDVNLDGEHNTPENLEKTLELFRSLEWTKTEETREPDGQKDTDEKQDNVFTFEDIKFRLDIPETVDYVWGEYELEQTVYKRCVQFVQMAYFSNENTVTMSCFECADGDTFDNYELEYLRDIEELSGGTMQVVDEIAPFSTTDPAQRAYRWSYRVDNVLFVAAYYLIEDTSWIFVDYLVGDEIQKAALEKSLETFELLEAPKPQSAEPELSESELDLSKSERPEVTRVKLSCNASIKNVYKVNYLHTGVVGLFGCPVETDGEIPSGTKLEFTYDPSMLNGIKPEGLIILHYNEADAWYDTIPSELDRERHTVTAEISESGAYMLADAYEWYRVWGTVLDEFKHDVVFRCDEVNPAFSITIPADVEFNPCGDYLKDSSEPNVREKDLVAGPGVLDLSRHDIVLTMKYYQRTDDTTCDKNLADIKEICDSSDEYSYEEYGDYTIFTSRMKGDPSCGINGSGSAWALMKISDLSWVYICYTYVYDKIDEYEPQAVNSIKSFKWE